MTVPFSRPSRPMLTVLLVAGAALLVYGCGGDDEPPPYTPPPPPPAATTVTLSGVVLDGPLQGARVCQDANDNRVCDVGEPSATTDANGGYSLVVPAASAGAYPLLAEAIAGTTVDADTGLVSQPYTLIAPAGKGAVISPYTTLLQSELDGGRAANLVQAEKSMLDFMVGTAGDVGGLTPYSNYLPDASDSTAQATRRARMYGLGQLLARGFAMTQAGAALDGKSGSGALGLAAMGSLQQLLSQVPGKLSAADLDTLAPALRDSLVPTAAQVAAVAAARAKTVAAPIEGGWIGSFANGAVTATALWVFAGDGTFMYRVVDPGVPASTSTQFDNGFGYRYGRYTFSNGTLRTTLIEASSASGPAEGELSGVTVSGNTLTADGGLTLTRVSSAASPLVGAWVRSEGSDRPEVLVLLEDGTYFHSTFYYQNDPETGTASFFETAKSAGVRKGNWALDPADPSVVNFGATSVVFNGTLAVPSNPGVAVIQPDGALSMTGLRMVKLGTIDGAKAVTGLSEATRSRLWSGRFFSRTVSISGSNRTQYAYVRGPQDVLTFLQAPVGSSATVPCGSDPATQGTPLPDFANVGPADGKLKQFVVGTGTAASAGYAQRRLLVGQPGTGNFVTYTPITKPTNATARCAWPL